MEIEVSKAVGPHFRTELEAAGLAHLYRGSAHRLQMSMVPDAAWRPGPGEVESARPEVEGPEAQCWAIQLDDATTEAERKAVLAAHAAHAPDAASSIHRAEAKARLNLLLHESKARVAGVPASVLGGKLAEYEEKARLVDAWARDEGAKKLEKPAFVLIKNRKDAYPARYASGQDVVDEWATRGKALRGKFAALVKIYDECVRDMEEKDAIKSGAELGARLEQTASSLEAVR